MPPYRKTVLVLGAGASAPYAFPLGRDLVQKAMSIDTPTERELAEAGLHPTHQKEFAEVLYRASPPSIDELLEHRPEYLSTGKLLIAYFLIPCENPVLLAADGHRRTWYDYLFDTIGWVPLLGALASHKLAVITFNYDRSLEAALARK